MNATAVVIQMAGHCPFREGSTDGDEFLVNRDLGAPLGSHQCAGSTGEVLCVAGDMEADDITTEQTFQNLFSPGEDGENVVTRKRRVVEEGDLQIWSLLSDVARRKPEVVIVNPDGRSLGGLCTGSIGKSLIDLFKNGPIGVVNVEMGWECVQNWPEAFLGGDVIKTGYLFICQRNPAQREGRGVGHLQAFNV